MAKLSSLARHLPLLSLCVEGVLSVKRVFPSSSETIEIEQERLRFLLEACF